MSEKQTGATVMTIDGERVEVSWTVWQYPVANYGNRGHVSLTYRHDSPVKGSEDRATERARVLRVLFQAASAEVAAGYSIRKATGTHARNGDWNLIPQGVYTDADTHPWVTVEVWPIGGQAARDAADKRARERSAAINRADRDIRQAAIAKGRALIEGNPEMRILSCVVTVQGLDFVISHSESWGWQESMRSTQDEYWQVMNAAIA